MNIVMDMNVFVSGILKPMSFPANVLNQVLQKKVILNLDARIFNEYTHVLYRDRFGFSKELVSMVLSFIEKESVLVSPEPFRQQKLVDPYDLPFIEVALCKNIPLITGNRKHFSSVSELSLYTPKEWINKP